MTKRGRGLPGWGGGAGPAVARLGGEGAGPRRRRAEGSRAEGAVGRRRAGGRVRGVEEGSELAWVG